MCSLNFRNRDLSSERKSFSFGSGRWQQRPENFLLVDFRPTPTQRLTDFRAAVRVNLILPLFNN